MKRSHSISAVLLAVVLGASCQNSFGQGKANIVILATGGTIAGAAATGTQSGYTSGQVTIDAMIMRSRESTIWPTSGASRSPTWARRMCPLTSC
jgi:L-asparaginase/Glu-tRNA(Gln) amidotransferase subunit D